MRSGVKQRGQGSWIKELHVDEDKQGKGQDLQWYVTDCQTSYGFQELSGQGYLDAEVLAQTHSGYC
eukprot:10654547-Heterocapsa_arctica.AAC.1